MKVISFYNYEIIIGQNARENWDIFTNADDFDLWFHLDDVPSCHIIVREKLKSTEKIDLEKVVQEAKKYCLQYSKKGKKVMYTTISNLKKGKEIGSVLIKDESKIIYLQ